MTTKKIKSLLESSLAFFGLGQTEVAVYLATLTLGTAPASKIAVKAGINRVTTYQALKRLVENGLAHKHTRRGSGVQYFTVESVDALIHKLEEKKQQTDVQLQALQQHKAELRALYDYGSAAPEVALYTGVEGVKTVIMDTLAQHPTETLSFASGSSLLAFDHDFIQQYYDQRVRLKIPTKGIIPDTAAVKQRFGASTNQKELRELRFVDSALDMLQHEIEIYGDNVAFTSLKPGDEHGIIIRSRTIAEAMREIFYMLWERLEM
jgi:sugar-specific transcriptional regulator TrmB